MAHVPGHFSVPGVGPDPPPPHHATPGFSSNRTAVFGQPPSFVPPSNWSSSGGMPPPMVQPASMPVYGVTGTGNVLQTTGPSLNQPFGQVQNGYSVTYRPLLVPEHTFTSGSQDPPGSTQFPYNLKVGGPHPDNQVPVAKADKTDLTALIANLRGLITQTKQTVCRIVDLAKLKPSSLPVKAPNSDLQTAASTFKELSHSQYEGSVTGNLHVSSCREIVTGPKSAYSQDHEQVHACYEGGRSSEDLDSLFSDMLKKCKDSYSISNAFFYEDASGVVQASTVPDLSRSVATTLPDFAVQEEWTEFSLGKDGNRCADDCKPMLPSTFWLLKKELDSWKDFPTELSFSLLQAAVGLARVKIADLKKWLLASGVVRRRTLANHILVLLVFCLRAVQREATKTLTSEDFRHDDNSSVLQMMKFNFLFASGRWLSFQLSSFCDAKVSNNLVLDMFKQALEDAAYSLVFPNCSGNGVDLDKPVSSASFENMALSVSTTEREEEDNGPSLHVETLCFERPAEDAVVGGGLLCLKRVAAALAAAQRQSALEQCRKAEDFFFGVLPSQRSAIHDSHVKKAAEVRATRTGYRAVLEHDGLVWQRPQNQEGKKNKTMEELLAEERDYKRRRMSYRGKKVTRTPVQVVRDIIESHMKDIVAAGGIGCVGRKSEDLIATYPKAGVNDQDSHSGQVLNGKACLDDGSGVKDVEMAHEQSQKDSPYVRSGRFRDDRDYRQYSGDENYRRSSQRSTSVSYSSSSRTYHDHAKYDSHHGLHKYDSHDKYGARKHGYDRHDSYRDKHGARKHGYDKRDSHHHLLHHDSHRRSSYNGSDDSDSKEVGSERKYDRWE